MIDILKNEIKELYGKISPFELKDKLIKLASKNQIPLLDAGRGNPNWIAATPRDAFFTFGHFAVQESRNVWSEYDLAGMAKKEGIYNRFCDFVKKNPLAPGIELLEKIIQYGVSEGGFDGDAWVYELVDGIIGDNYPNPDRMLTHIETVVNDYLIQELGYKKNEEGCSKGSFKTFAVEGATAAMCYIFDTLIANNMICKGDKIAIMTPVFTPYLEIPHLPRYSLEVVKIEADEVDENGASTWQYSEKEIAKLADKDIKIVFIVNPSNPASVAMKPETVQQLKNIVEKDNRDLMIVSDDVYSTFVDDFRSLMADLPYNTLGVYSYSKYFGVTGWRLGTIALNEENVFDKLLKLQDYNKRKRAKIRYGGITADVESLSFIDRIVADSRQVALNHTAGLSTPQQVQMAFFSVFAIIDKENRYKQLTKDICRRRKRLLFHGLGAETINNSLDAAYYSQIDLLELAVKNHGEEFVQYLKENYDTVDVLIDLADKYSVVLLSGSGFDGPEWSVRVSLANLKDEAYEKIGQAICDTVECYAKKWKKSKVA